MRFNVLVLCIAYCLPINLAVWANCFDTRLISQAYGNNHDFEEAFDEVIIDDFSNMSAEEASKWNLGYVNKRVPRSYTRNILTRPDKLEFSEGKYIINNSLYLKIKETLANVNAEIRDKNLSPAQRARLRAEAISEARCGNCREMMDVGGVGLIDKGFTGNVYSLKFGDHGVLLIEKDGEYYISDAWAYKSYPFSEWVNNLRSFKPEYIGEKPNLEVIGKLISPSEIPNEIPKIHYKYR